MRNLPVKKGELWRGKAVGYIRVSTVDQILDRQLKDFDMDKVFEDKVTGSKTDRPGLKAMLQYVRGDDHIFVHSIDRLARNLIDLHRIVEDLLERDVCITFVKENITFSGDGTKPMDRFLFSVLGAFAEFERDILLERQREGIIIAQAKGMYKGRMPALTNDQIADIKRMVLQDLPKTKIAKRVGVSRQTLYKYLNGQQSETKDERLKKIKDFKINLIEVK